MTATIRYPTSRFEVAPSIDLGAASARAKVSRSAVRGVINLARAWQLTADQTCGLLGDVAPSTWYAWVKAPPRDLGVDRLTRVSYLLGIYSALHVLYPRSPLANEWVTRPNTNVIFGGQPPLAVMLAGGIPAMDRVRALLDARRGGT